MPVVWEWILEAVVLAIHEAQLVEHGGPIGARDLNLLRSALARPQNLLAYGHNPDAADLATSYASGIVRNHPFVDGNKRTAFVTMELFLELNGFSLHADDASCISNMEAPAADPSPKPTSPTGSELTSRHNKSHGTGAKSRNPSTVF